MRLQPLTLSAEAASWTAEIDVAWPKAAAVPNFACAFCGIRSGAWQQGCTLDAGGVDSPASRTQVSACPLCALARHLERPRIDDEAALIWLPEMSQAAINALMRDIHRELRQFGDGLHADDRIGRDESERRPLHYTRAALAMRAGPAAARLGTSLPSDLARALLRLPLAAYGRRASLLGGLRLLPLGRFYVDGEDVYPDVVDTWLGKTPPPRPIRSSAFRASPKGPTAPTASGLQRPAVLAGV